MQSFTEENDMPKGIGYGKSPHEGYSGGYKDYMRDEKSAGGGKMGKATKKTSHNPGSHGKMSKKNSAGRNYNDSNPY